MAAQTSQTAQQQHEEIDEDVEGARPRVDPRVELPEGRPRVELPRVVGGGKRRRAPTADLPPRGRAPTALDLLAAEDDAVIKVTRIRASGEGGSRQEGACGSVSRDADLATEIGRRWGGGTYRVTGYLSDGDPVTRDLSVPGRSLSLTADDDTVEDEDYLPPPPRVVRGGGYSPGFDYQAPPAPPPYAGGAGGWQGPSPVPDWYRTGFNPAMRPELDRLKDEVAKLQRELELERMAHAQTKGELAASKERERTAEIKRGFDAQIARLEAQIASAGTKGPDPMAAILQMMQQASEQQRLAADRDAASRRAEADAQREMLRVQLEAVQARQIDPIQAMGNMLATFKPFLERRDAPPQSMQLTELLLALKQLRELAKDEDDDDVDDEKHPAVAAIEAAMEGLRQWQQGQQQAQAQAQLPQPVQPPQLPAPRQQQEPMSNEMKWLALITEVQGYMAANDDPSTAAHKLAQWAHKQGAVAHVQDVMRLPVPELAAKLEARSKDPMLAMVPGVSQQLAGFAAVLRSQEGAAWVQAVVATLKGGRRQ